MKTETVELKSGNGDFLKHKCTEVYKPEHRYIFDLECNQCDYKTKVSLKSQDLFNYHQGEYIQNAFPYIDQATRGLMLDGICYKCWDKMFPEDIDEELHLQE
jgi:hypothetical protein